MAAKLLGLPLVVITGPTASGKTSLAIRIAKKIKGEIICADSRSIYKGADVGTAKPTKKERSSVLHWGLNLVEPGDYFTVADFKNYSEIKIDEIRQRGHIPFLVGGTGLYIDSIVFDYKFGPQRNDSVRTKLQQMSLDELHEYCEKNKITLPENYKNKRYVIRAIENKDAKILKRKKPIDNMIIVGISTEKDVLRTRIKDRTEHIFDDGVVEEAKLLGDNYGWDNEAMKSNIYPLIHAYLTDKITLDEAKKRFITLDWRLAKRQITWLKRNEFIQWFSLDEAEKFLIDELANRINP